MRTRLVLATLWVGTFGCGEAAAPADAAVEDAPPSVDAAPMRPDARAELVGYRLGAWGSCASEIPASDECATFTVPIDWEQPRGATLSRTIIRRRATGTRRGVLLWNPGGPGVSTYPEPAPFADTSVAAAYDTIGMDWRGVGTSEPLLDCPRPASGDEYSTTIAAGSVADAVVSAAEAAQRAVEECRASRDPVVVAHMGSTDMVRDMEALRIALHEERISYVGYSYGTALGAAYATRYPQHVDAFVLDSAVWPNVSWLEANAGQIVAQEHSLERYLRWCVTVDCDFARGRDATQLGAAFDSMVAELMMRPRFVMAHGISSVVPGEALVGLVARALADPAKWRELGFSLAAVEDGDLTSFEDTLAAPTSRWSFAYEAIEHADEGLDRAWEPQEITEYFLGTLLPQAPHMAFDFGFRIGAESGMAGVPMTHLFLGAPDAPRMLVIGTRHDPQTPYDGALAMRDVLGPNAHLVTYEGDGHAMSTRIPCLRSAVVSFLLDPTSAVTEVCAAVTP